MRESLRLQSLLLKLQLHMLLLVLRNPWRIHSNRGQQNVLPDMNWTLLSELLVLLARRVCEELLLLL